MTNPDSTNRRPRSLREVLEFSHEHGDRDACLREFLDEYYLTQDREQRGVMLTDEPELTDDDRVNAYLAAVAEHLAIQNRSPVPAWTQQVQRFLRRPYFPIGLESLKASLIMESPAAFRRRMIFVSADPLYRPRRSATLGANIGVI